MAMNKRIISIVSVLLCLFSCNPAGEGQQVQTVPHYRSVSIGEFVALTPGSEYYHLTGTVASVEDVSDSHFTLEDKTGKVTVYGLWESAGGPRIKDMGEWKVGSEISIAARRADFNGTPEARKAFPYDPKSVGLYVSPLEVNFSSGGGTAKLDFYSEGEPSFQLADSWLSASMSEDGKYILLTAMPNEAMDSRTAYLFVATASLREKVKVIQDAYIPAVVPVSDAFLAKSARVAGTVTALSYDGCVLTDESGSIFVSGSSPSMEMGAVLDVTGEVSTQDFLTAVTAHSVAHAGNTLPAYPNPENLTASSAASIIASLEGKDPATAGVLPMKYVTATGLVSVEEGIARLRDFDTDAVTAVLVQTPSADYSALDGSLVSISGYILGASQGSLRLLASKATPAEVASAVTIDGDFSDWESVPGGWSGSGTLLAFKLYCAGTDIYMYAETSKDAFTEWGAYKYFVQVYFNTDRNTETGPVAWVFKGLDSSGYVRMTAGKQNSFNTSGGGSLFHSFLGADGLPFVSANPNLFAGSFFAVNGEYPCGGKVDGEVVRFEWKFPMSTLGLPRHSTVGAGLRFCHEGPDTPSGEQENFFLPADGWAFYDLP